VPEAAVLVEIERERLLLFLADRFVRVVTRLLQVRIPEHVDERHLLPRALLEQPPVLPDPLEHVDEVLARRKPVMRKIRAAAMPLPLGRVMNHDRVRSPVLRDDRVLALYGVAPEDLELFPFCRIPPVRERFFPYLLEGKVRRLACRLHA
jgi:hypothetical protein